MSITTQDITLLRTIARLSQEEGGPPSLAELAIALGFKVNSRGNVQRHLAKLRPHYVNWTSNRRSIRLTEHGQALLEHDPTAKVGKLFTQTILPLLASGLTHLAVKSSEGKPLSAPYPVSWQRALNMLSAECLLTRVAPPSTTVEAIEWCQTAFEDWPIVLPDVFPEPLLYGDEPTEFCRELAEGLHGGNAELEISELHMKRLRDEARLRRDQTAYVTARRYLIEHAVVRQDELLDATFGEISIFGDLFNDLYEHVPTTAVEGDHILMCGHCGWTLERRGHRLFCGDDRCRHLTANFTRGTRIVQVPPDSQLLRVRRAIRRYVTAPGAYEIALEKRLVSAGVLVELWPEYDSYDIKIDFTDISEVWAVDVKDWRYPHLLARQLKPLRNEGQLVWDKAFYVVPDERVIENQGYLTFLQGASARQTYSVVSISELIEKVINHGGKTNAS